MDYGTLVDTIGGEGRKLLGVIGMLKLALQLIGAVPTIYSDIRGVLNEIKDQPRGQMHLSNALGAMKKLIADLEAVLAETEK